MSRPITAETGTPCYGAAGDAVEIQQAGGMQKFKQGLMDAGREAGFKAGYAEGYSDAMRNLESRVSNLENQGNRPNNSGDQPRHRAH